MQGPYNKNFEKYARIKAIPLKSYYQFVDGGLKDLGR